MVEVADQYKVGQFSWSAVRPLDDVVSVQTASRATSRELASVVISLVECPAYTSGHYSGLATDRQRLTGRVFD